MEAQKSKQSIVPESRLTMAGVLETLLTHPAPADRHVNQRRRRPELKACLKFSVNLNLFMLLRQCQLGPSHPWQAPGLNLEFNCAIIMTEPGLRVRRAAGPPEPVTRSESESEL
jgi:hypothetical protein